MNYEFFRGCEGGFPAVRVGVRVFIRLSIAILLCIGRVVSAQSVDTPWRFAVMGDSRGDGTNTPGHYWVNTPVLTNIAEEVIRDDVSLVLFSGDLIMGNNYWDSKNVYTNMATKFAIFKEAVKSITEAGIPFYPVRGNHETYDMLNDTTPTWEATNAWLNAFGSALPQNGPAGQEGFTYSFTHGNALFVGLEQYLADDYHVDPDFTAVDWLNQQFAANTNRHVFVFGHAPVFQAVDPQCLMRHPTNATTFWSSMDAVGVRLYLCAHEHFYGRARACVDGAFMPRQVIMGSSGGPTETGWDGTYLGDGQDGARVISEAWSTAASTYGYLLVEVDGPRVTMNYKTYVAASGVDPVWTTNDTLVYTVDGSEPIESPCYTNTIAETSAYATNLIASHGIPALSIAVVDDNRIVWAEGFGFADRERGVAADADTIYRIASMSKAFAGLTVMSLEEDGLLNLGDPVTDTVPTFSLRPRYTNETAMTIRSLMAHRSGIPGIYFKNAETTVQRFDYYQTVLALLGDDYPNFPPDFMEQYNDNGFTMLEGVVAGASGKDYITCATERLFTPMGLTNTVFTLVGDQTNRLAKYYRDGVLMPDEYVNALASGGNYSTVRDLSLWMSFLMGYGTFDGQQVVTSNSVATVWTDQTDGALLRVYDKYCHFGLGWDQVADPEFTYAGKACWKNGASEGYGSFVIVMPDRKLGVVVLNSYSGDAVVQPIARYALKYALLEKYGLMWPTNAVTLPVTSVTNMTSDDFASITGRYATGYGYDIVAEDDGVLTWTANAQSTSPAVHADLVPHEDGWFYVTNGLPSLQVSFTNAEGRVFMKKRFVFNNWVETAVVSERFVPAPISSIWSNRAARTWIVSGLATDSYYRVSGKDLRMNLIIHDGVLMVSGFGGNATLQPQSDDLAFAFAAGSSDVTSLQGRMTNGYEALTYGGFDFHTIWTPGGFGGGGADQAVYDPIGRWYALAEDGTLVLWAETWGGEHMIPAPGDYDGDGRGDLAVYDTATGEWYIRPVTGSTLLWREQWGSPDMIPVMGDYDGDGLDDMAVYHALTGDWYIRTVSGNLIVWAREFGWSYARPVPGDYDGDGSWDLAVYYEPDGLWYIYSLQNGLLVWAEQWGGPGMAPVTGDFDGDGVYDMALYQASTGNWYIRTVSGSLVEWALSFGGSNTEPVAGDYDGDGTWDLGVYSEEDGLWYVYSLQNGVMVWGRQFGGPGLMPVMRR